MRGFLSTAVSGDPSGPRVIYDNEQARAQTVVLPAAAAVTVERFIASRAGLLMETLPALHGRVKLRVAANSVAAVMS